MDEPIPCQMCGAPEHTTEILMLRTRKGKEPRVVAFVRLCDACADRMEGKGAPEAVPAAAFVKVVTDDRR